MRDTRTLTSRPGHEPHNQAAIYEEDGNGHIVAITYNDEEGQTAAELVKRWNAHADLLAALKALVEYEDDAPPEGSKGAEVYAQARAAITNAH